MRCCSGFAGVLLLICLTSGLSGVDVHAQELGNRTADEQAIRQASEVYLAALNRGDVKTLASLWTADGTFIDETGTTHKMQEQLRQAEAPVDATDRSKLRVEVNSIRFASADVAVEDGSSEWTESTAGPASQGRYTAVWVKRDGKWLLDSVRESSASSDSSVDQLQDLEWMNGEWIGKSGPTVVEISSRWADQQSFIVRSFKVTRDGQLEIAGTQRIGWDPIAKRIRSWVFDIDGSFGEGYLTRDGDKWIVETVTVVPDGVRTSTTNVYTQLSRDSFVIEPASQGADAPSAPRQAIRFERRTGG